MALAFESINPKIIKELKWRGDKKNEPKFLSKVPYVRLTSFAVPKNDVSDMTGLRKLREQNVLKNGFLTDLSGNPVQGYGYANNSYRTGNSSDIPGLYKGETNNFSTGRKYVPNPGIVSLSATNRGSYGSLRGLNFQIKCYDLAQLEALEVLYMTPGIGVLAEWGWSHDDRASNYLQTDLSENAFKDKEELQKQLSMRINGSNGNYDACIATISGFNWNIDKDGSYNIQVDAVSRGETILQMTTNRSNSVLVDYIGRLTYDPDVETVVKDQKDGVMSMSDSEQQEKLGVSGLKKYNVDGRAGEPERINLLRVPIWEYDFGLEKLEEIRNKIQTEADKARNEEILQEERLEELQRTAKDIVSKGNWFFTFLDVMAEHRMNKMEVASTKNTSVKMPTIDLPYLSINGQPNAPDSFYTGQDGTTTKPLSAEQIFATFTNWKLPQGNNVGIWDMANWEEDPGDKNDGKAGFAYQWAWNCARHDFPNSLPNSAEKLDNLLNDTTMHDNSISDGDGLYGYTAGETDGQSHTIKKVFRPAFISNLHFDGGYCPILGQVDGIQIYTNVYHRNLKYTIWAGDDQKQKTGAHRYLRGDKNFDKANADTLPEGQYHGMSTGKLAVGNGGSTFNNIAGQSKPSSKFKNRFFTGDDAKRIEDILRYPYYAPNNYGECQMGVDVAASEYDKEADLKIWKCPDGSGDPTNDSLHIDATYLQMETDFSELQKKPKEYKFDQKVGHGRRGEVKEKEGDLMKPMDVYLRQLPRLPMFAVSIGMGNNKVLYGGQNYNTAPQASKISPKDRTNYASPRNTGGAEYPACHVWYSFVDMQEIDPSTGEFKYLQAMKKRRADAEEEVKALIEDATKKKENAAKNRKVNEDYLARLNDTVGQYIPIWAIERILNNTVNFNVNGKRLFRFDSGFHKYGNDDPKLQKDPWRPANIGLMHEKRKILYEYKNLFQVQNAELAGEGLDDLVEGASEATKPFSDPGWKVFQKYFSGPTENTVESVAGANWTPEYSLPTKIANNKNLKSTNPLVCLLPGQEDTSPNSKHYHPWAGADKNKDNRYTTDELMTLYYEMKLGLNNLPNPDLWVGLQPAPPNEASWEEATKVYKGTGKDKDKKDKLLNPYKLWTNTFKETSFAGSEGFRSGYVGNILVHLDIVKSKLQLATLEAQGMGGESGKRERQNAYQFLDAILQEVSAACGQWWEFGLQIDDKQDNVCRIVDKRYTKDIGFTKDIIWKFPLYGSDLKNGTRGSHIIRDFSIQSMIPNGMKAMAMYGTNAAYIDQTTNDDNTFHTLSVAENVSWADISLENIKYESDLYIWNPGKNGTGELKSRPGLNSGTGELLTLSDLYDRGSVFDIPTDLSGTNAERYAQEEAELRHAEDKVPVTFEDQRNKFEESMRIIHDNGPNDSGGRHARRAEKCLYAMLNHPFPVNNAELDAILKNVKIEVPEAQMKHERELLVKKHSREALERENPNFFNTLIPLDCSITLDGISGIYYGNSFTLGGLPKRYENKTAFQITNVSHTIDTNGWQVNINGTMRPLPQKAIDNPNIYIKEFTDISEESF